MPASLASGQDALSTNPATRPRTWRAKPGRRLIRGAVSFGYFSLGKQRKVTRPPAGGRKPAAGEPDRGTVDKSQSHWIPAFAGMTVREIDRVASTRPSPQPSPRRGEGVRTTKPHSPREGTPQGTQQQRDTPTRASPPPAAKSTPDSTALSANHPTPPDRPNTHHRFPPAPQTAQQPSPRKPQPQRRDPAHWPPAH